MNQDTHTSTTTPQEKPVSESPSARSPLLDAKIMMVDDDPLMTELIHAYLEDEGYTNFISTNDPTQALDMLRNENPELLLLDLVMPGVSGFDLLEAVRVDPDRGYPPVIVLTAATDCDSKLHALRIGATDFLSKPVDASELVLRVRNTLAFQQYHERLFHFDQVTGLPNESLFEQGLDDILARRKNPNDLVALFSITVPECRELRESIDRKAADGLAVVIAQRLERLTASTGLISPDRPQTRLTRLGEQHFGLVFGNLADINTVEALAKITLTTLAEPITIDGHEIVASPWIGIAVAPGDGQNASTLRQNADLAATHGHKEGFVQIAFASPELNTKSYQRLTQGAQLRHATERDELRLHYQPKIDMTTRKIIGVEALVRWQHPDLGLVPPLKFIPLAEEMGLMLELGQWVIERACKDIAHWMETGIGELKVSVNVSKPQIMSETLEQTVLQAISKSGIHPRQLIIELTESMLMDDVTQCLSMMHRLKKLGVTLSLDDFGTGYSSLAYLKKFPIDELKIDRTFVIDLPGQASDKALVRTIIDLGHSLGMAVTAEGIETVDQFDCLKQLGCDLAQGFLMSKPLQPNQCADLIASGGPTF